MIGKPGGIPESPLHFSDEKGRAGDPTKTYARFGLVFRVADTAGVSLETAQFVGTVALHEAGITNANDAAAEYHAPESAVVTSQAQAHACRGGMPRQADPAMVEPCRVNACPRRPMAAPRAGFRSVWASCQASARGGAAGKF